MSITKYTVNGGNLVTSKTDG